ncbi:LANO_0H18668g1_1 [Lachancea nothofagi CBS 11611]|uniref:LANO_0H18668g1_1 n=1 Tax=Lachancea nothofagi CBS 11611 TaxID=1266666 RepID=A0A1G4KN60_9SACH|nr:LANO_0H18668g1_1 [Lachancea nothofagi CBS 11611]
MNRVFSNCSTVVCTIQKPFRTVEPFCLAKISKKTQVNMSTYVNHNTDFKKPVLDDRKYRFISLPNNLKALLIQDPETDKSAASLDVNIGSFDDPEYLPGLAHFCEHLLFMGSSKFPNENEYSSYLSKHGGGSNAYTSSQNTNYFFQVNHENLYGALDRFSGFFTCPSFNKSSTDKEINAVDSENKKNLQSDLWRLYQLDKSLTSTEHPFHKFSTGNMTTLGSTPKFNGLNIRDELLKFYNSCYSANLMKLCILGREDLDDMSKWVYDLFKDVPNSNLPVPSYPVQMLPADCLTQVIHAKPVKDLKKVELTFRSPDSEMHWESKPSHHLSHLIGHEGSGSLLAFLKMKGWANELSAGAHTVSTGNALFSVDVDLTDNGIENYEQVVLSVFQYIELLKQELPQDWIYTELRDTAEANFKFKQKGNPSSTVSALSKALEKEFIPTGDILSTSLLRKYEPDLITSYLAELKPENSRVTLIHKNVETDSEEKWYGTEYSVAKYSENFLSKLKDPGLNPHLHLPRPNEFISTNFQVDKLETGESLQEPLLLRNDSQSKLWYKRDDRFWVPKGHVYVSMKLPHTFSSVVNSMLTTLYVDLVNDSLKDLEYDAQVANLHISFRKTNQGLDISLSGYNQKMAILLTRYLEGVSNFKPSEDRFKIFQNKLIQKLNNHLYEVPYSQISDIYNSVINERSWTINEKLEVVKQFSFTHLKNFIPTIYEQFFFETLVHGNFNNDVAIEIDDLVKVLAPVDIQAVKLKSIKPRSILLPRGKTFRFEQTLADEKNINSCIQHITQFGVYSEERSAKAALLAQLIDEPAFDTLRTKEQLGYVVFSSALNTHGTTNLRLLIQSERDTAYLESRVEAFLIKTENDLESMTEEEFGRHKSALCKTLLQKYKNLSEEYVRFSTAIYIGDYNFVHKERKASLVEKLTKAEILEFYRKYVMSEESSKLVIHLKSQVQDEAAEKRDFVENYPTGKLIRDIGRFQSTMSLAPVRQPLQELEVTPKL